MVDRRILAAIVAVVAMAAFIVVRAGGGATTGGTSPTSIVAPQPAAPPVVAGSASTSTDAVGTSTTTTTTTTARDQPSTTTPGEEATAGHDHEHDDGDAHGLDLTTAPAGDLASAAAVSWLSWRYDDPPGRLAEDLAMVATSELLDRLAVDPAERGRRQSAVEVSWAIVTVPPVVPAGDGEITVRVSVEQHLVTATSAETVTPREVTVALTPTATGWLIADLA